MDLTMTKDEREAFLAEAHVGILAVAAEGRAPLAVPIWYGYEPGGEVWFITEPGSRKARLLEATGHGSLCAQDEKPPYRYVSVEGPVSGAEPVDDEGARFLAHRYLGAELGDLYLASAPSMADTRVYRMRPEVWHTVDYGKEYTVP